MSQTIACSLVLSRLDYANSLFVGLSDLEVNSNVLSKLCMCVRVHTGRETSAHKKTWSAHKWSLQNCVLHTLFHIQKSSGYMLHKRNFMRTQTLKN